MNVDAREAVLCRRIGLSGGTGRRRVMDSRLVLGTMMLPTVLLATNCLVQFEEDPPVCGDGVVSSGEECDDSNLDPGDGCDSGCQMEPGWQCESQPSTCSAICGDGRLVDTEDCDGEAMRATNCDAVGLGAGELGCLADCRFDVSACERQPECGNGIVEPGEECDDQNTTSGDGCSSACHVETGWRCQGEPADCSPVCGDGRCLFEAGEGLVSCPEDCRVVAITAGDLHTCALIVDGSAWCWGRNVDGQLGDDSTTDRKTPVPVSAIENVEDVSAGSDHTCALVVDGSAWCWGGNYYGDVGDGSTTARHTAVEVSGLHNVRAISAGQMWTCSVLADGSAWCWGWNDHGQLGDGSTTARHSPVQVSGVDNIQAISAGGNHTCALIVDGSAWCWGRNNHGQLGDGSHMDRYNPSDVSNLDNVRTISAGGDHTCALRDDGSVWCWGRNDHG